ncbi:MAG: type I polyketide synthase [Acidimicrobiales bacterium]
MNETAGIREPVAIVGIGCRLPGGADSPQQLWQLLCDEFDAIGPVPSARFDVDTLYDARPATPGRIMSQWGGFLEGVENFDAAFFGIAPREADRLDPQQRLLLETAWEALDDAGMPQPRLAGTNTGVFVGMWLNEYESRLFADPDHIDFHMTTGSGRYTASGRLSFFFDLLGPSVTIDTACSSSLVAVHLACQSLWTNECDLALAGGANVILQPNITIAYSQSRMMAPDGRCKFGDAAADGYVRSDGAAIVALKRLSSAIADGDEIYAVIRGSAVTNDGRSSGFLATPGQSGQEEMLRVAYAHAGVDPRLVQYVEAHGTGTAAGDPVELGALGAVVGAGRDPDAPCLVGSVKTNIGHTEGAAGVTGLIKVALALKNGELPASLHVRQPNPAIAWAELGLALCTERRPFSAHAGRPIAAVSSFGISGTNAHVVLEAAPPPACVDGRDPSPSTLMLAVSAAHGDALRSLVVSYEKMLAEDPSCVAHLCANAALRRNHHAHRLSVVAGNVAALRDALAAWLRGEHVPNVSEGRATSAPRVAFVFPGQGAQWHGMARELLATEPVFREAFSDCDRAINAEAGWSPLEQIAAEADHSRLDEIDIVQPLLFATQVALAALWRSWGIEPDAVVGHSMGEVAAAYVAGALALAEAAAVICRRSILLRTVRGQGAMAVVDLSHEEAQAAIAGVGDRVQVAATNSPRSAVISGEPAAVQAVMAALDARDVFCRAVNVDVASHSAQMDPLLGPLRDALTALAPVAPTVAFYSTVGSAGDGPHEFDGDYWAGNLREPVLFARSIEQMARDGHTVFVEMSPHPILLPAIEQVLRHGDFVGTVVASLRRGEPERASMLSGLGQLYTHGAAIRWSAIVDEAAPRVALANYPWQRERFWYDAAPVAASGGHPWLGRALRPGAAPETVIWERYLVGHGLTFLRDHVVLGAPIMPAAGFIEFALAAAEVVRPGPCAIDNLDLAEMFVLGDTGNGVQLLVEGELSGVRRFTIFGAAPDGTWRPNADGLLRLDREMAAPQPFDLAEVSARCASHRSSEQHLAAMQRRGLRYGPAFRAIEECWIGSGEVLARLVAPVDARDGHAARVAVLDGCLQLALAALPIETANRTFLPVHIDHLAVFDWPDRDTPTWAHATVDAAQEGTFRADITVVDSQGIVRAAVRGLQLRRSDGAAATSDLDELLYETVWHPIDDAIPAIADSPGTWLVFASTTVGVDLADRIRATGDRCVVVTVGDAYRQLTADDFTLAPGSPRDYASLLAAAFDDPPRCRGVVYNWATDIESADDGAVAAAETLGCRGIVALVQALDRIEWTDAPRLWLVTRGAQPVDAAPMAAHQAVVWGLGRVVATERPERRCTLIDLDPMGNALQDQRLCDDEELFDEIRAADVDRQVARRGDRRHAMRLQRRVATPADSSASNTRQTDVYRLVAATPGNLDTLAPRATARRAPRFDEIEVRVEAGALNFLDVLKAMGIYPGFDASPDTALGAECAGTVVALGPGVREFAVGDHVIAITPSYGETSMLASFVTIPAMFAVARPDHLTAQDATTLPVALLTAYYALHELGRIREGEQVLIHSATGGVGLAALQLCRRAGAQVFATAGNPQKRDYLRSLGVDHVFDSRSLDFADEILSLTDGRGVDVVLNSLAGEAIAAGLRALAPRGRFIEIGKRDVYANRSIGLAPFMKNLSLFVVDLARMTDEDPAYVAGLFREVMALVAAGRLDALPHTTVPITSAADAFRTMAQAGHIGKLVLSIPPHDVAAASGVVRGDGTYLITGGFGALGLAVAQRLAARGAQHIALLGRSRPSDSARAAISDLEASGVQVLTLAADVADEAQLEDALDLLEQQAPPLRGIVHAAGVLADATLTALDDDRLTAALAPKLAGGWNIHKLTRDQPLDFFVCFSSVAALLGLAGQANYAAGNAFLDALAHQRRDAGVPALSVDWGPWSDVGLAAAEANRGERLARGGLGGISSVEALDCLELLLAGHAAQASVMRFDADRWVADNPSAAGLLTRLTDHAPGAEMATLGASLRDELLSTPSARRRRTMLEDAICTEVAPVLRVAAERIDRNEALKAMGLDSLMALELRNRLEVRTGLTLSATTTWNYPTVAVLAGHLAGRMAVSLESDAAASAPRAAQKNASAALDAELSQGDLEAMLDEELAAIDKLLNAD